MKRNTCVILTLLICLGISQVVMADPLEKDAQIEITASSETIYVGDTVTLTSVSKKNGSEFVDNWCGNGVSAGTTGSNGDTYQSTAEFKPQKPGTYTITYSIYMSAGNGKAVFCGNASKTIEVIGKTEVIGITIKNIKVIPMGNVYLVSGDVYLVWSDDSTTLYSSVVYFFGENETNRDVSLTVPVGDGVVTYCLSVSR